MLDYIHCKFRCGEEQLCFIVHSIRIMKVSHLNAHYGTVIKQIGEIWEILSETDSSCCLRTESNLTN